MKWALLLAALVAAASVRAAAAQFQTGPCANTPACKCKWSEGKRMADCRNAGFNAVPTTLSDDIQGHFHRNTFLASFKYFVSDEFFIRKKTLWRCGAKGHKPVEHFEDTESGIPS